MRTFKRILATVLSIALYFGICNFSVWTAKPEITFQESLAPTFVFMFVVGIFVSIILAIVSFIIWLFD